MEFKCPNCGDPLRGEEVNISTDLAQCSKCGTISRPSELVAAVDPSEATKIPVGSKIELVKKGDHQYEVHLPPSGFTAITGFIGLFAIVWIGFITVWTSFALYGVQDNPFLIVFALFSLPFWWVGFALVKSVIGSFSEKQYIRFSPSTIEFDKRHAFGNKSQAYQVVEIESINLAPLDLRKNPLKSFDHIKPGIQRHSSADKPSIIVPSIIINNKRHTFFERARDEEQRWIVALLKLVTKK